MLGRVLFPAAGFEVRMCRGVLKNPGWDAIGVGRAHISLRSCSTGVQGCVETVCVCAGLDVVRTFLVDQVQLGVLVGTKSVSSTDV